MIELLEEAYADKTCKMRKIGILSELGKTYRFKKEHKNSIEILKKAHSIEQNNVFIMNELGISYRENKDYQNSIDILKKAVEKGNIPSYNELGKTYRENKDYQKSIEILKKGHSIKQNDVQIMNELGISYRENKDYQNSIDILKKAVEKGHIPSYNELGKSYRENKDYQNSIDILKKAVEKGNIQSYTELGKSYRENGQIKEAKSVLERALKIEPNNQYLKANLKKCHQKSSPKDTVRNLIEENKTGEVIVFLKSIAQDDKLKDNIAVVASQFKGLEDEKIDRSIENKEANTTLAKIHRSLLALASNVKS